MHAMTRAASTAVIRAPFQGLALRFKADSVELSMADGSRFATVRSKQAGDHLYRLTRVIGGHHREDYAGVEVTQATASAPIVGDPKDELILPMSYLIALGTFRYKGYSVMSHERPGLRAGPVWNRTCIFCHNTQPYFSTMLGALPGARFVYQGATVDALLPETKRWRVDVTDQAALDRALEAEVSHFGGRPESQRLLAQAIDTTRANFDASALIEVGIGCEACHLGSRAHATNPDPKSQRTSLVPRAAFLSVDTKTRTADELRAASVNHACARCHQVLFSHYPYTWEGGDRNGPAPAGGSNINSGEARDFMLGACSTRADCTACHDPHSPDNSALAKRLEGRDGDAVCTKCHAKYLGDDALRTHSHHDPVREGARCMGCHMPRKNMSLDGKLTRYHRIGAPTDRDKQKDRPLECALCHVDKSVRTILESMESWYGKKYDWTLPTFLYGSLDANVMVATLERGKPHEQAVALHLLGEARIKDSVQAMARELTNEYPLVRTYAKAALEKTIGEKSPVDLNTTDDEIRASAADWLKRTP